MAGCVVRSRRIVFDEAEYGAVGIFRIGWRTGGRPVVRELHSTYSRDSSSGASKSVAIRKILCLTLPALHGQDVREAFRTCANGCSWPVIVISSRG